MYRVDEKGRKATQKESERQKAEEDEEADGMERWCTVVERQKSYIHMTFFVDLGDKC